MNSKAVERCLRVYLARSKRLWWHLPASLRRGALGRIYGRHVHGLVRLLDGRSQNHSTFFLRNRPELEVLRDLLGQKDSGATLNISILACSKGSEAYSFMWRIRSARSDLKVNMRAVDISPDILAFAERGVYSRGAPEVLGLPDRDVPLSIFERMTDEELESLFDLTGDEARVKPWLKEGIAWLPGDAGDPDLAGVLGPQDIVVANRFLCHMKPSAAEKCLRNIAGLVRPGGYLFVSGVDLDVRTRVAHAMGWKPVTDLIKEVHEGDPSLASGWPLEYWGLEPFCADRPDWRIRYASVFQIGYNSDTTQSLEQASTQANSRDPESDKCAFAGRRHEGCRERRTRGRAHALRRD